MLIDKAQIEFSSGLCSLSGETGSGKSILLDSLGLAIGFRSNLRLIGSDEKKALVNAEFDIENNQECLKILEENDLLDLENPNELRIRRIIKENSSSKAYVNDNAIGISVLAKIGETLVEIHGQHDQRGLLNSSAHLSILDDFAQNQTNIKKLDKSYNNFKEIEEKIVEIKDKKEQAIKERDYLEYIIKELENADILENEEDDLINKKDKLKGREKTLEFLNDFKSNLIEANSNLNSSQNILIRNQNIIDNYLGEEGKEFAQLSDKIDQQNIALEAAISNIEDSIRDLNNSDENLDEVEERLFQIRGLARKFNCKTEELPTIIIDAQEKLRLIDNEEEFAHDLEKQKEEALRNYDKIAKDLSQKRQKSAKILSNKVEDELKFLKMENVKFLTEISTDNSQPAPHGYDKIKFRASLNKNNFDDISKIASGGELSRFMLALKVALMDIRSTPTMIFDEIDTGIGGNTANAVGKRLKILSQTTQILVVTHQPQIASKADTHFKISKSSNENRVKTHIEKLDENGRKREIARMLSGEEISEEALAAASKLIKEVL